MALPSGIDPVGLLSGVSALLNAILTGILAYFYFQMRETQESQKEAQLRQTELMENQTEVMNQQMNVYHGQNRPILDTTVDKVSEDLFKLKVGNKGSGIAKRADILCGIYIPEEEVETSESIQIPDTSSVVVDQEDVGSVYEIWELDIEGYDFHQSLSAFRPEESCLDISRFEPGKEYTAFVRSIYRYREYGEYKEEGIGEVLSILHKLGVSQVVLQFDVKYEDMSGVQYFDHLLGIETEPIPDVKLEDIISGSNRIAILREEIITRNYRKIPDNSDI